MTLEFPIEDVIVVDVDDIVRKIEEDYKHGFSITPNEINNIVREHFDDCWCDFPYTEEMVQKTIATVRPLWSERLFKLQTLGKRVELIKAMQDYLFNVIGDEELIEQWLEDGIPDNSSDEEIKEIVKNAQKFTTLVNIFGLILENEYMK